MLPLFALLADFMACWNLYCCSTSTWAPPKSVLPLRATLTTPLHKETQKSSQKTQKTFFLVVSRPSSIRVSVDLSCAEHDSLFMELIPQLPGIFHLSQWFLHCRFVGGGRRTVSLMHEPPYLALGIFDPAKRRQTGLYLAILGLSSMLHLWHILDHSLWLILRSSPAPNARRMNSRRHQLALRSNPTFLSESPLPATINTGNFSGALGAHKRIPSGPSSSHSLTNEQGEAAPPELNPQCTVELVIRMW